MWTFTRLDIFMETYEKCKDTLPPCTLSFISTLLIRRIPRIFHFVFHKTEIKIDRKFNTVPIFWNNLIQWVGISLWNWQIIFINSNYSLRNTNTICTSLKLNTFWYTSKFFDVIYVSTDYIIIYIYYICSHKLKCTKDISIIFLKTETKVDRKFNVTRKFWNGLTGACFCRVFINSETGLGH